MNQPIFKRERQALSDAEVDEGILLYEGGGKRPKVPYSHGRQYAPDNTISTLETAKLIKFQRTEQYPNGASVAAYILTKKGETWIDNANKARHEKYVQRSLKTIATSQNPELQKLQHSIDLAQKIVLLPEDTQKAFTVFLEILNLPLKYTWMENAIKLEWAMEGQTTTRLMLLAFFATLPDDIRQVALNALHETDAS